MATFEFEGHSPKKPKSRKHLPFERDHSMHTRGLDVCGRCTRHGVCGDRRNGNKAQLILVKSRASIRVFPSQSMAKQKTRQRLICQFCYASCSPHVHYQYRQHGCLPTIRLHPIPTKLPCHAMILTEPLSRPNRVLSASPRHSLRYGQKSLHHGGKYTCDSTFYTRT